MRISDVKVRVLEPWGPFKWTDRVPESYFNALLFTVVADNGLEGHCITWLNRSVRATNENLNYYKQVLVGEDPHYMEKFSQILTNQNDYPSDDASALDIAIWDLLGKAHNEPVYKLLGAKRDKIKAYASTVRYNTDQEYIDLAFRCIEEGYKAFKTHAYAIPDDDIRLCRALRAAVGDKLELMHDPLNEYTLHEAIKVGKVLHELNYAWLESPIRETDVDGLAWLRTKVKVPITAGETRYQGLFGWTQLLKKQAVDSARAIGDHVGGITVMRKMAAIAEGFGVNFETHSYGPITITVAHLHMMLAQNNCEYIELTVPYEQFQKYSLETVKPDKDGFVHAPTKPGLGYDLDWNMINAKTLRELDGKCLPGEIPITIVT